MTQNPWKPVGANSQSDAAIAAIASARRALARHSPALQALRKPLATFDGDLAAIAQAYEKDAAAYRLTRSFTVVHLPAIMSVIDVLQSASGDHPRVDALSARLLPCLASATQARTAIAEGALAEADITMAVLERQVVSNGLDPEAAPADPSEHGLFSGMTRFAKTSFAKVTGATTAVQSAAIGVGTEVVNRSAAGASLLKTYAAGACEDGVHALVTPITTRLQAARTAVFDVGLVAIFFPPAVPFAVGLALLDAPLRYEDALEKARTAAEIEREKRLDDRRDAADFAIAGLRGLAEVVRIETPFIALVIDATSGDADGTILAGRHIGKTLTALDADTIDALRAHAPDRETQDVLESWQRRVAA